MVASRTGGGEAADRDTRTDACMSASHSKMRGLKCKSDLPIMEPKPVCLV